MATRETIILGVLNLTPDSFSDGAVFADAGNNRAIARANELAQQGADIIDIGGESTRPGATLIGPEEEQRRVIPVIRELANTPLHLSIDTINASTAEAAVLAGVRTVNDVSGGLFDPAMLGTIGGLCADHDLRYIIGHWRGVPDVHHTRSDYGDVVTDIASELDARAQAAIAAGVPRENIVLDPGLGFDKTATQCWEVLRRIDELQALGYPVCVGVSRKRMLADIVQETTGEPGSFEDRDLATSVVTALAARAGVWAVRVHDVAGSAQALAVTRNWPAPDKPAHQTGDRLTLTGLHVHAYHGVFDFEREAGQQFIVDLEVDTDLSRAGASDHLGDTLHYGELAERVVDAVKRDPVDLIETLAERVARVALEFEAARSVRVTVHKPEAPIDALFDDVSVTIERSRQ